jgi:K+-transporting ATPase c subunit
MSNGNGMVPPTTDPASTESNTLDIQVLNNGVKLLGEAVVPGAALLLEKQLSAGLVLGTLGLLGGAALGSVFGPLGYVLARYGASAVSFSQSIQDPPPKPAGPTEKQLDDAVKRELTRREVARSMQAQPAAFTAAVASASDVVARLERAIARLEQIDQPSNRRQTRAARA